MKLSHERPNSQMGLEDISSVCAHYYQSLPQSLLITSHINYQNPTRGANQDNLPSSINQFSAAGAGHLALQLFPHTCVAVTLKVAPAMMAAWQPNATAGPLRWTQSSWK